MPRFKSSPSTTCLLKPANLSHQALSHTPVDGESSCCVPVQCVSSALSSNPVAGGNFVIFRRKTRTSAPVVANGPKPFSGAQITSSGGGQQSPTPQTQTIDVISGHGFALTQSGSIIYTGKERALESKFVNTWDCDDGTLKKLEDPDISSQGCRFALFGPGNHASNVGTLRDAKGKGTWKRLLGQIGGDAAEWEDGCTHCVYMDLPDVIGHMIALGVPVGEVVQYLVPGEYGTMRLKFQPADYWKTPEQLHGDSETEPLGSKVWKTGWWVTSRKGMGVWIS